MTKCFEIFVILGLLVFQVTFRAACFLVIPGLCFLLSSPGCSFFTSSPGCDPGIHKETGKDKGKRTTKRKEFLLTILSSMLLKKKKRATRKLWHNDDNRSGQARLLGEETENE